MWGKDKKTNILIKSINKLINMLEKSNYMEFAYLLRKQKGNNKKKYISRDSKRSGSGNRSNNCYSNFINIVKKNRYIKYSYIRRIYFRHCRNCGKKQIDCSNLAKKY